LCVFKSEGNLFWWTLREVLPFKSGQCFLLNRAGVVKAWK